MTNVRANLWKLPTSTQDLATSEVFDANQQWRLSRLPSRDVVNLLTMALARRGWDRLDSSIQKATQVSMHAGANVAGVSMSD
jgi:hypothetical protein